jgi:hypothetical protein
MIENQELEKLERLKAEAKLEVQASTITRGSPEICRARVELLKQVLEILRGAEDPTTKRKSALIVQDIFRRGIIFKQKIPANPRLFEGTKAELEAEEGTKVGEKISIGIFATLASEIVKEVRGTRSQILEQFIEHIRENYHESRYS